MWGSVKDLVKFMDEDPGVWAQQVLGVFVREGSTGPQATTSSAEQEPAKRQALRVVTGVRPPAAGESPPSPSAALEARAFALGFGLVNYVRSEAAKPQVSFSSGLGKPLSGVGR